MSLGKLMKMSMARKAERAGPQRGGGMSLGKLAKMSMERQAGNRPSIGGPGDVDAMMGRSSPRMVAEGMKKGGKVKKMAKGGSVSKRADGCCSKGKTKGKFV